MLQKHIADALLTLQDQLEHYEIFVLHSVDVAGQVLRDLLDGQGLRLLVILV